MLGALGWAAALALAAVFAVAGWAKLADRAGTRRTVEAFGTPGRLSAVVALLVPLVELAVAGLLVVAPTRAAGGVGAITLLSLFSLVVGLSLARGHAPACHCFGQVHSAPVSGWTLGRNAALGAAGVLVLAAQGATTTGTGLWVVGAGALVAAALGGSAAAVVALMRSHGRLLVRLDGLERALTTAGIELEDDAERHGLSPGDPAPAFSLAGVGSASLDALLEPGHPLLLVFTSPGCEPCRQLLPLLGTWRDEHTDRLEIAVLTDGSLGQAQAEARDHGLAHVLVDDGSEVLGRYQAAATPSAVLIGADGAIESWVVAGIEAIAELVEGETSAASEAGLRPGERVPELELTGLDGTRVRLTDPAGRSTLLVFWNPGCGFCSSMREELVAWDRGAGADAPRLLVVSSGEEAATRADGFGGEVALDPEMAAGAAFGASGTPMAVLVDGDGRVASSLAAGAAAVLALAEPPRLHVERVGT